MAIVQISKIQHRYGNLIDLPQLDNAELGYAIDEKRLFIGTSQTGPDENVEVLTSFSEISFSQISGAGANINVDTANLVNGQVLAFNGTDWVNKGGDLGGLITLGSVDNVKLLGGSAGFVLETDGTGNLIWAPKNVISAYISNITQASPAVITTTEPNFFIDGSYVLITDVVGMTELNGNSYYTKILTSSTFELYTDVSLTIPVNSTLYAEYIDNGRVITDSGGGGAGGGAAGGSNTNVQFNYNNIVYGVPDFSYDFTTSLLSLNGKAVISGNANVGNLIASGTITSTGLANVSRVITTALTGTAPLQVVSTTKVANLNVDFLDGYDSSISPSADTVAVRDTSGNLEAAWFIGDGTYITNINGAAVFGQVPNALIAGSLYLAAQPNITSTGTLANLSVSGNVNVGLNISATGNVTSNNISASGNLTVTGNITSNTKISATGDITGANLYTGGLISATGNITGANISASGNITGANLYTGGLISATGNITGANLYTGGLISATGNITGANISGVIRPTSGTGVNGIIFPANPGGGSGDLAVIQYYASVGEQTILELSVTNDPTDIILINASGGTTINNTLTTTSISTGANTTAGTLTGNWTLSAGSQLQATYADLAEYYEADMAYEPGTVLEFGGEKEVTLGTDETVRVAGVVSTNPAYAMNAGCQGEYPVAIALQGRVPVKVRGNIRKGDMMISGGSGFARPSNTPQIGTVIGKSLENFDGVEGVIEIAVGRL